MDRLRRSRATEEGSTGIWMDSSEIPPLLFRSREGGSPIRTTSCYDSKSMPKRRRLLCLMVGPLLGSVLLSSCMTTALWGGTVDPDSESANLNFDPEFDGAGDLLLKVVLTPFAVVYDVCTSPVQAWIFGWIEIGGD